MQAVVLGVALSFIMCAANIYVGLYAGMTVSAAIPASVISMEELFRRTQQLAQIEFKVLEAYVCAACWYLLMTTIWGEIQKRLEAHYDKPFGPVPDDPASAKPVKSPLGDAPTQA